MKNASNWLKNAILDLNSLLEKERKIGVQILELLLELETRKAYAELKYDGLYSFCVKELKFSESQAFQRIQAMHALRTNPELKEKIESGSMSVSTVAQVQVMIRQEQAQGAKLSHVEKKNLFNHFDHKTSKEVKEEIHVMRGEKIKCQLVLELDEEAERLWKEFKAHTAHQTRCDHLNAFKVILKSWMTNSKSQRSDSWSTKLLKRELIKPKLLSRYIPSTIRQQIFARDGHQCTQCHSTYALTIEHIVPFALGGTSEPENLKTLCRSCNQYQGIKVFGQAAMKREVRL